MCSLRFDIEENTIIEAFVRFRFASVAITIYRCPYNILKLALTPRCENEQKEDELHQDRLKLLKIS